MPVYLRRFYTQELIDLKKGEEKAIKKNQRASNSNNFNNPRKSY
tara:strand:+ start:141 stop:272 length:132 start_codon:yes stop_codon:yes gene_type:complete